MKLKYFIAAITAFCHALSIYSVPACPGIVERHQPDGSVVRIRILGDEFNHYMLSEDGYPVLEKDGSLFFAEKNSDNRLVASSFKVSSRDSNTDRWLSMQDKEELRQMAAAPSKGRRLNSAPRRNPGLHATSFPHVGEPRALVILVEYQDVKCTLDDPETYFSEMLNQEGFKKWGGTGSARDYFIDNSMGQFKPQFDLYGPVTLPENMAYYGRNVGGDDAHAEDMVIHACQILDPDIDFSVYDHDKDGLIDNVFIFYAGRGENSGGSDDTVWPHSWDVRAPYPDTDFIFDDVQLGQYACSNEWKDDRPDGIGTFVHEFSHVLGLPDLYVTGGASSSAFTPGAWSVMDMGPYNNKSRTPSGYSLFERYAFGWVDPRQFDKPDNLTLEPLQSTNQGFILFGSNPNEYFLFENRQQQKWDSYIPGHGMLVWHVDYDEDRWNNGGVNNVASHQHVDLLEADAKLSAATRPGDAFPGTDGITSITHTTNPSLKPWTGEDLETPITDIRESKKGIISFKVKGGLPASDTPVMLETSEVGSYGFTVNWLPVDEALRYELSIRIKGEDDELLSIPVEGSEVSCRVDDIAPETTYVYALTAWQSGKGESIPSADKEVTTGEATFEWFAPVALEASSVEDRAFTAVWQPLDGAVEYFVTLFDKQDIVTDDETYDFSGGRDCLPNDWLCTSEIVFDQAVYAGESAPSLRLNGSGNTIESSLFDTDINSISFWHRGVNNAEGNFIRVYAFADNEWVEIQKVEVTESEGGRIDTVSNFPIGSRAFRIYYIGENTKKGPIAIDDLTVRVEKSFSKRIINGIDRLSVGDETSVRLDDLMPETTYFYVVSATDGTLFSRESKAIRVRTLAENLSEVGSIETAGDSPARYYTLQGFPVSHPTPGQIYIRRTTRTAEKIIFR